MSTGLGLIIHHNIYLNREQRYALYDGQDIEVSGVSVSVWCRGKVTSEPAKEIYCRYLVRNLGEDQPIKMVKDGFEICLPNKKPIVSHVSDEIWRDMSVAERDEYYALFKNGASPLNLLDVKDGGSGCLMYREHNKIRYADDDGPITIIHLIQLRDIRILEETCTLTANWA
jgi:hypothetical protein